MRSMKVLMLVGSLSVCGCVTQGVYQKGMAESYQRGFKDADNQCLQLQMKVKAGWDAMANELADKTTRLDECRKSLPVKPSAIEKKIEKRKAVKK